MTTRSVIRLCELQLQLLQSAVIALRLSCIENVYEKYASFRVRGSISWGVRVISSVILTSDHGGKCVLRTVWGCSITTFCDANHLDTSKGSNMVVCL